MFDSGNELVEGPVPDHWGTWITALVPIKDPEGDELIAVLGIDIDARGWKTMIVHSVLPPALLTLLLIAIILIGTILLRRRFRQEGQPAYWMSHIELELAAAGGLVMTLFAVWAAHHNEHYARNEMFAQTVTSQTSVIAERLHVLRDTELEGLARFYEGSENVTFEEFQKYSVYLTRNRVVQTWSWIPAVPAEERARFEAYVRATGLENFAIWEKDLKGEQIPAAGRDVYYPILQVAPLADNEKALGYDIGSEPLCREAVEEAARTGLPTGTDIFIQMREGGTQDIMRVYRPVFDTHQQRSLRGFVMAACYMDKLLERSGPENTAYLELKLLQRGPGSDALATETELSLTRPVMAFGKAFALTAYVGNEFLRFHPSRAGKIAALSGLLLTALLSFLLSIMLRHRSELERLVAERTSSLRKSEEHFRSLVEGSPNCVMLLDAEGRYLSINQSGLDAMNWIESNVIGKHFSEVWPENVRPMVQDAVARALKGEQTSFEADCIRPDGLTVAWWVILNPILEESGCVHRLVGISMDITERKRTRETLQTRALQQAELASFSEAALAESSLAELFGRSVALVSRTLGICCAEVLEHHLEQGIFSLRACVGCMDDCIGQKSIPDGPASQSGYTLMGTKPVISEDLRHETRFSQSELVSEHNLICGLTVAIPGTDRPFGILGAYHDQRHAFTDNDVHFMEALANVLAAAIRQSRAEEELIRFRMAIENSADQVFIIDCIDMHFMDVNNTACETLGYTRDELLSMGSHEIKPLYTRESLKRELDNIARKASRSGLIETIYRRKDGSDISVEVRLRVFESAGKEMIVATARDVSAQKRTERRLRLMSSITANMSDSVVATNARFEITYLNKKAEELFGYSLKELQGQSLHIFNADPVTVEIQQELNRTVASGKIYHGESLNRRKDGSTFVCEYKIFPLVNEDGTPYAYVEIQRDITERKRAENELRETNSQLEKETMRANRMAFEAEMANIAKGEFLANMSHEIRTPMNGVIGMTELLLYTELNDEQMHYAETVRKSSESLLGLINDILDFSKIEAKKLELEILAFDLQSLLENLAVTFELQAHAKGLELVCGISPEVPPLLLGDPGRLRQILANLIGNAVKFTHSGEVAIYVTLESETAEAALLRFSVRDTGIGIPVNKQKCLFQVFAQVDASTARKYGGTGLGLAISRQLVEIMGGAIGLESEVGKGSEFWFTVRFTKQPIDAVRQASALADLQNVRVLIVDDNATNRDILNIRMTSWNMRVYEASEGPEAIEALYKALDERDPFRIAVIDMQMPGMDGESLGLAIKSDRRLAHTRMLILTSMAVPGDAKRFAKIGFDAYLTKPVRVMELKTALSHMIADRDSKVPESLIITTRHVVREIRNIFAECKARILLAEDNLTNQQVALGILKRLGLQADSVFDGKQAIDALKAIHYDLVLMDIQMPEMDGLEATRQIRDSQSVILNHEIPIIAMTAHAMIGDREKCLKAGMNGYITKPIRPLILVEELEKFLLKADVDAGRMNGIDTNRSEILDKDGVEIFSSRIFDRTALLERLMRDKDLTETIIAGFLEDMPKQMAALKAYVKNSQAVKAGAQAHKIKGAAGNVTGTALREIAYLMEKAGKAGDKKEMDKLMPEIEKQFALLKVAMEKGI